MQKAWLGETCFCQLVEGFTNFIRPSRIRKAQQKNSLFLVKMLLVASRQNWKQAALSYPGLNDAFTASCNAEWRSVVTLPKSASLHSVQLHFKC